MLQALANELDHDGDYEKADLIRYLVVEMKRRKAVRRAPPTKKPMSFAVRTQIKTLFAAFPDASQQDIAEQVGVTAARVSEVIAGKRK
jgi:antitoxin component HigA of HigAB toxin-antitoxin module